MTNLRRVVALLIPVGGWMALSAVLAATTVGSGIGLIALAAYLIAKASMVTSTADLGLAITGVRFFAVLRATSRYADRYIGHLATFRVLTRARVWLFRSLEPLVPARTGDLHSGDLLSRIGTDVDALQDLYLRVVLPPVAAAMGIALASVVLGSLDPVLGATLAAFLVATGVGVPLVAHRTARGAAAETVAVRARRSVALVDHVQGLDELVAFGRADDHARQLAALDAELDRAERRVARVQAAADAAAALLAGLATLATLALAIPLLARGELQAVWLAAVPLTALASFEAVQPLANALADLDRSRAAATRLFDLVDAEPAVVDAADPAPMPDGNELELRSVSLTYGDGRTALRDVDLRVPEGRAVAIVGPSGSGKSSLVGLLERFWPPDAGTILLGGVDVACLDADDVRRRFAVVAQHDHLFDTTVRDNLRLADPDASDEALERACRLAGVHDTIAALPSGYRSRVGDDGDRLSGGERQRLLLARALLADAPVLVLDEATAHLDVDQARTVLRDVFAARAGATTIVIAHDADRLPAIDDVVRLDRGRTVPVVR